MTDFDSMNERTVSPTNRELNVMVGLEMLPGSVTMEPSQSPTYLATVQIMASTTSSIHLGWEVGHDIVPNVQGFQVYYQKVASKYVQYGPMLPSSALDYNIQNLVADTYYKVCLAMYRNDTVHPVRDCVDASTTNWHIPVSIGSSIGAVLALSMIVLMVLLSRCPSVVKWRGKQYKKSAKYDSMSSHYHDDHFEFSETATHGHDDEFVSETDHTENVPYEVSNHCHRKDHNHIPTDKHDKMCNGNRPHVIMPQHQQMKYNGARPKMYGPAGQHVHKDSREHSGHYHPYIQEQAYNYQCYPQGSHDHKHGSHDQYQGQPCNHHGLQHQGSQDNYPALQCNQTGILCNHHRIQENHEGLQTHHMVNSLDIKHGDSSTKDIPQEDLNHNHHSASIVLHSNVQTQVQTVVPNAPETMTTDMVIQGHLTSDSPDEMPVVSYPQGHMDYEMKEIQRTNSKDDTVTQPQYIYETVLLEEHVV